LSDVCLECFNVKEREEEGERRLTIVRKIKNEARGIQEKGKR
jgi:hypothetical protein